VSLFRRRRPDAAPAAVRATPTLDERVLAILSSRSTTGPTITVDQLPIVQGLANLHADMISQFPLYAVDETGHRVVNTPDVLEQPDPSEPLGETLHAIVQSMWYTGNAIALRHGDAIRLQNPNFCGIAPNPDLLDDRRITGWLIHGQPVAPANVVLWKINDDPRHGPLGDSPLKRCWQAVENYAWAYRYLADYYSSGGNPSILLKSRNASDPGQADELWAQWIAARQAGRPAVIPYDIDVAAAPVPSDISDTVAVLEFCAAEICRATNTPPSIGNAPVAAALTYSTTVEELRRWLVLSLGPTWLTRLERGFTSLVADAGLTARFDTSEMQRLDMFGGVPTVPGPAATPVAVGPAPARLELVS
jgi:portal protein